MSKVKYSVLKPFTYEEVYYNPKDLFFTDDSRRLAVMLQQNYVKEVAFVNEQSLFTVALNDTVIAIFDEAYELGTVKTIDLEAETIDFQSQVNPEELYQVHKDSLVIGDINSLLTLFTRELKDKDALLEKAKETISELLSQVSVLQPTNEEDVQAFVTPEVTQKEYPILFPHKDELLKLGILYNQYIAMSDKELLALMGIGQGKLSDMREFVDE